MSKCLITECPASISVGSCIFPLILLLFFFIGTAIIFGKVKRKKMDFLHFKLRLDMMTWNGLKPTSLGSSLDCYMIIYWYSFLAPSVYRQATINSIRLTRLIYLACVTSSFVSVLNFATFFSVLEEWASWSSWKCWDLLSSLLLLLLVW